MIIATAIMQSKEQRMSLGSIYNWIERKYPYFTKNDATQGYVFFLYFSFFVYGS